jgi:hypothetical protein
MNTLYDGSIITVQGMNFKVSLVRDDDMGFPWENEDGHGEVSQWTRRSKAPGEMTLCEAQGMRRYYDFQSAVKLARQDRWNTAPYNWRTKGEQAHQSAMADFDYLRRFCTGDWEYVNVGVSLLDDNDDLMDYPEAEFIGGVEYDPRDSIYVRQVAEDLANQIIETQRRMFIIEPQDEIGDNQDMNQIAA